MFDNDKPLKLLDLIDIELLQELQDAFSNTTGIASISVDDKGPITNPSKFTDFCYKYTRSTNEGYKRCNECDITWGKIAAKSDKPVIYKCHAGLSDFAVPIIIEGQHVASILGGQVFTEEPNEAEYRKLAKDIGIDADEYIEALKKIKVVSQETINASANFLFLVANTISKVAHKNLELIKKNERESILRNIIATIRETLDFNETKKTIVTEIGKVLNADRVILVEFDPETNTPGVPDKFSEYLKSENEVSFVGFDFSSPAVAFLANIHKETEALIIEDMDKYILDNNLEDTDTGKWLKKTGAKTGIGVSIFYGTRVYGVMTLHFIKNKISLNDDQIDFLKTLVNQTGIALYQAELYKKAKKQTEREFLIRKISSKIRKSLNIEETLFFICSETAKLFDVQRAAIASFLDPKNHELYTIRKEYKSSKKIQGFGSSIDAAKTGSYWVNLLANTDKILAFDNINIVDCPDYFKQTYTSMGVKSIMATSIQKDEDIWGTLVLSEYNKYRHWTEEEKLLLKIIADQVYIAINQAELFEKVQKIAENESTLRRIMLSSVSIFDIKEIINTIVKEEGKLFNADRCFFIEVDSETNSSLPIKAYAEYLSSNEITSHVPRITNKSETEIFIKIAKQKEITYSNDVNNENLPEETKKMLIEDLSVKSYLIVPVYYGNKLYGLIVLHYVKDFKTFTKDETDMAIAIANQSAVVIHQAELFELTKIQQEREKISKNIVEILRSSLDKNIIKHLFVKNIGKLFDADRVFFSDLDIQNNMYAPVDENSEYLSDPEIKSFVGYDWSDPEAQEYVEQLLNKREFHIYNWEEYMQGQSKSQQFINLFEKFNIKSIYSFPVMYQFKMLGFFSIGFTKEVHRLTYEDITRIRNICTQAGIALHHANLYQEAQKSIQSHEDFVNKLSNELKDPLNMIIKFSELLSQQEQEREKEVEQLNIINSNARKLLYFLDEEIKTANSKFNFI